MSERPFEMRDDLPPELKKGMKDLMDAFLICAVKRAGGRLVLSVKEVDAANDFMSMATSEDSTEFILTTETRQ